MNSIKLSISFEGSKGNKILNSVFNNQTTYSCIDAKYAHEIAELTPLNSPKTVIILGKLTEIRHVALLNFYINDLCFSDEFMVVLNLKKNVVFGRLSDAKMAFLT